MIPTFSDCRQRRPAVAPLSQGMHGKRTNSPVARSHQRRRRIVSPALKSLRMATLAAVALTLVGLSGDRLVAAKQPKQRDPEASGDSADGADGSAKGVYNNQITGQPEIQCGFGVVHFRVLTEQGHASSIYVRGQSANPDCVFHNANNVTIELAKCNIRRKREVKPSGVAYQMTVVVQMHPLFVTKVDRAYNVNCFYMERHQDVGTEFNVSDLSPSEIAMDAVLPNCTYSVRRGSPNGPLVRFTRVGEQLYHVWECPSSMYKMLLYNCAVVDSEGSEYSIIDERGFRCSRDEFLMPQISYAANVTKAMVATAAFNFPDRNKMSFSCKIRLCYTNECSAITPPKCGAAAASAGVTPNSLSEDRETDQTSSPLVSSSSATTPFVPEDDDNDNDNERLTTESDDYSITLATSARVASSRASRRRVTTSATDGTTVRTTEATITTSTTTQRSLIAEEDEEQEDDDRTTPIAVPDDFPRPKSLHLGGTQADEPLVDSDGSGEEPDDSWASAQPSSGFHFVGKKVTTAVSDDMADGIEINQSSTERLEIINDSKEHHESTPPMVIFNKISPTKAATANVKNAAKASRAEGGGSRLARDTTPAGAAAAAAGNRPLIGPAPPKHVVDFDITSDELTIVDASVDDFNRPSSSFSVDRDRPTKKSAADDEFARLTSRDVALPLFDDPSPTVRAPHTVCLSPLALALAGALGALFLVTLGFVALRASRKTAHAFH